MADKKKRKEKKKRVIKKKMTDILTKVILPITYTQYRKKCCVGDEKENIALTNKLLIDLLSGRKIGDTNGFPVQTDIRGVALGPTPIMRDVYSQTPPPDIVKLLPNIPYEKQYAYKENKYLTEWERLKRRQKKPRRETKEIMTETEVEDYIKEPIKIHKEPMEEPVNIPIEEQPVSRVPKKKPLSRMNKTELQEEYKRVIGEEPDKRFSKKDMYVILKK